MSPASGAAARPPMRLARLQALQLALLLALAPALRAAAAEPGFYDFEPGPLPGRVHYYASAAPGTGDAPGSVLIALHGHARDARTTFDAALQAVRGAQLEAGTLVVAPLFQVDDDRHCHGAGVPPAQAGDLLWTCASWARGEAALGVDGAAAAEPGPGSWAVLDALVLELARRWPSLRTATIAGFSAGAQLAQRHAAFGDAQGRLPLALRYVVADPGSWLYFDPVRPQALQAGVPVDDWARCAGPEGTLARCTLRFDAPDPACPSARRWHYGTDGLPATAGRSAEAARAHYAAADIRYLEGALDTGAGPGTAARVLDRSCAAQAQGPFRLQRGLAYGEYDRIWLAPVRPRPVVVVPGCAHSVRCVFPAAAARAALFGPPLPVTPAPAAAPRPAG